MDLTKYKRKINENVKRRKKIRISKYENNDLLILNELFHHILLYVGNPHNLLLLNKHYYYLITKNLKFIKDNKLYENYIEFWKEIRISQINTELYYPLNYPMVLPGKFINKKYREISDFQSRRGIMYGNQSQLVYPKKIISGTIINVFKKNSIDNKYQLNNFKNGLYLGILDIDTIYLIFHYACNVNNKKIIDIIIEYNIYVLNSKKTSKIIYLDHTTSLIDLYKISKRRYNELSDKGNIIFDEINPINEKISCYYLTEKKHRYNKKCPIIWHGSSLSEIKANDVLKHLLSLSKNIMFFKMNIGFKNAMIRFIARGDNQIIIELLKLYPDACNLTNEIKKSFLYYAYERSNYDIVKIIEENKYFNKEKNHSVVHVIFHKFLQIHDCSREKVPNCTKIIRECITDFKKFLENGYNLDFPDHLGHTIIFKIVEFFNSCTIMMLIETFNLYDLKKIKSLNLDNPEFLNSNKLNIAILNPATVGIVILKKLIELGYGFPDYEKCSFKRTFCTTYSKNILNYCAERSVLSVLKMVVIIITSTKMDPLKFGKILITGYSTSISLWSNIVQPCTNYRINTVDYMTSLPFIRKSFSRIFRKHFSDLVSRPKVRNSNNSIIELDIKIIRNNFPPDSTIVKKFWHRIHHVIKKIINEIVRMRQARIHILHGFILIYVLKKYSHHLNILDKICKKDVMNEEGILCTKLRKETKRNLFISTEPPEQTKKIVFQCELKFIKEIFPEIKEDIIVYLKKK